MQREQNNQEQIKKRNPLVCFHQYGEDEDAGEIFIKIKEFKKNSKLKFTHFKQKRIIYFIVPTDDVTDFSSIVRFTRSTSSFKLVYKCGSNENEATTLASQKDSFIRIKHVKNTDDDGNITNDVLFTSNLPKNLHVMASRRIFESAGITFDINKAISDNKKHRYDAGNEDTEKQDVVAKKQETLVISINSDDEDEKNSDDEEIKVEEKIKVEVKPKKREKKQASQISRKI